MVVTTGCRRRAIFRYVSPNSVFAFETAPCLSSFRSGCCAANRQADIWEAGLGPALPPTVAELYSPREPLSETWEGVEKVRNGGSEARKPARQIAV